MLRVEYWPAFDQSEIKVMGRRILDETAAVFGESSNEIVAFLCFIRVALVSV